jgi:hypothetical protein
MRKKTKMANICRSLRTKNFFSPVLMSPTHIGFTDVKKNGSKISHLGTFKQNKCCGSMTFWCGSVSGSADPCLCLMDSDPTSVVFDTDLQDVNIKLIFFNSSFFAYCFLKGHLHYFSKIKGQKEVTKQ